MIDKGTSPGINIRRCMLAFEDSVRETERMEPPVDRCSRCGEGRMRSWEELTEEERQVTQRLPANRDYSREERRERRRWCTRCWHEAAASEDRA